MAMKKKLLMVHELLEKINLSEDELNKWRDLNLIVPAGYTDDEMPVYYAETIEKIEKVQKLIELGYELEDVQKIEKKVGMPGEGMFSSDHKKKGQYLTVGNLAERVGVSTRTIKHWEDKGIIEPDTRSEGGFRLYSETYIYLCQLIKDLQLFGYSLEEIKTISDYFRDFLYLQENFNNVPDAEIEHKIQAMLREIDYLNKKIVSLKDGIQRWEDLLKKKRKDMVSLQNRNEKRRKEESAKISKKKNQ
jgi:DNA-binding transcriptional MerR regulator